MRTLWIFTLRIVAVGLMIGLYFFCRWLAVGISPEFGYGAAAGAFMMIVLFWIASKVVPEAFQERKDRF